jgi:hypothetical protein
MEVERPAPPGVNVNQGDKRGRRKFYGILAAEQSLPLSVAKSGESGKSIEF